MVLSPNFFTEISMKRVFLSIGISVLIGFVSFAQECGTVATAENLEFMKRLELSSARSLDNPLSSPIVTIPIKFHALKTSAGAGGMSEATKDNLINNLNAVYAPSNMIFEHVGEVNEIVDDDHYDFDSANEGAVAVGNDVQKTLNVYFFNSIVSGGSPLCGYTRFPPSSDRVFMANACISGGTFEHEIGHYFTLFHTHGTTNTGTTDELVDGSNCSAAGDRVCDTAADPNLSGVVNATCAYTGTLRDANGDEYKPDPSNFMSYAPGNCRDKFSAGQNERIRRGFEEGRSYLNFTTEGFSALISSNTKEQCIGGDVRYEAIAFGAATYEWTFEGGQPETSEVADPRVTYESSGTFDVELKVTDNSGQEIIVSKPNFVKIDDPLENTLEIPFVSGIDSGLPIDLNVDNPDQGFTFEYSNVDSEELGSSGSIFINNRDYFTENLLNVDKLFLRNYSAPGIKKFTINFDYAYTYLIPDDTEAPPVYDSLTFQIRSQCASESVVLWHTGGEDLKTADALNSAFVPTAIQWKNKEIEFVMDEALDFVGFEFVSHSYNGNNLYLDNISFTPDFTVDPPIDFRLGKVAAGVPTLRWFDGSNNETAYVLERSINDGEFSELIRLDPNTILFRDSTLEAGNNYAYRLFADGVNGNTSVYTDIIEVNSSQITTGIEEELDRSVLIYPNPAVDKLQIFAPEIGELMFNMTDISGKVLVRKSGLNNGENTIDISGLRNGIYLINIFKESKSITKRLIKK